MTTASINPDEANAKAREDYDALRRRLATPGVGTLTFSPDETAAFYAIDGCLLSATRTLHAIEQEMTSGAFNPAARRILALDDGSVAVGAEYLATAGKLRLPLTITTHSGVDLGAGGGCLDKSTLRNSVPREQRYEINARAAATQILRRYYTDTLHLPHTIVPPSVWWPALFGSGGADLINSARFINRARSKNRAHSIDSFRAALIAAVEVTLREVWAREPDLVNDVLAFMHAVVAGFRGPDTPKDDPACVAHNVLTKLAEESKVSNRVAAKLDARAFLAVLTAWEAHVAGKGLSARNPALNPTRVVEGQTVVSPRVAVAIPKKRLVNA